MTYEEFIDFVPAKCIYETIYEDSEGRLILVIDMLSAYGMLNKAKPTWVGLTEEEVDEIYTSVQEEVTEHWDKGGTTMMFPFTLYKAIEQALKEKNT